MVRLGIISLLCLRAWAQTTPIAITVHAGSPSVTIPSDFLGLSFETGSLTSATGFPAENGQFQRMVSQLGLGWLRFGGNSVDKTTWIGGQLTSSTPTNSLTASDVDRVTAFARATGWRLLWSLRLANGSSATDADEADYVITHASDVLAGLEIGNEPDLFARNGYMPATLADYLTAWGQYAAAVKARHSDAVLTGPADSGNISTWTTSFANQYGPQIALLTQHFYPLGPVGVVAAGASNEATIANMLDSKILGNEQSQGLALNNIVQKLKIPWRMAETNSCYSGGQAGVSDVFASALWGIDYMFTLAGNSAAGVNFHGGGSGSYTPIAVSGSTITARPLYYALLFFGAAAHGRVVPVDVNAGSVNVTSFGVLDNDGTLRVTVINKDQALSAEAQISPILGGFQNASVLRLSAPTLTEKTNITLGGASVAADGTWAPLQIETAVSKSGFFPVVVPAGGAVVVSFGNGKLGIGNTASGGSTVAPNSMASVYGQNLGFVTRSAPSTNLAATLAAVSVSVTDSTGETRPAQLIYVSPSQVNIVIPDGTAPGTASVYAGDSSGTVQVAPVAPGLFTMGATKVAAATAMRYPNDGSATTPVSVFDCSTGTCQTTPIALDGRSTVYLTLYGTGIRGGANVICTVGGVSVPVQFAGPQGQYSGFDQVNIQLPPSLSGKGTLDVVLTVDGSLANTAQIGIK
jgi:uncharacterized protein (TIGR03437 family)